MVRAAHPRGPPQTQGAAQEPLRTKVSSPRRSKLQLSDPAQLLSKNPPPQEAMLAQTPLQPSLQGPLAQLTLPAAGHEPSPTLPSPG